MKEILPWILLVMLSSFWISTYWFDSIPNQQEKPTSFTLVSDEEKWAIFEEAELLNKLKSSDRPYLPFLNNKTMSCGIYRLEAGAEDKQQPHEIDEVYYTLNGKAKFTADGVEMAVKPGTILFVAAHADHRFHDIEEDLELLVFFSKKKIE